MKNSLTQSKFNKHYPAAEILTTATCPLNCKYCYIPKSQEMQNLHQKTIQQIKNGVLFDNIEKAVGNEIEYLGFWGTEPALTLNELKKKLDVISQKFPKLKQISFSTSSVILEPIWDFAKALSSYNIKLDIQISLDGPAFITDKNRFQGAAEKVPKNFFELVSQLQDISYPISFKWKATFSSENIRELNQDPSKMEEYDNYFKELNEKFKKVNKNKNITLIEESFCPTLAVPGRYTSQDGKEFTNFLKNFHQKGYHTSYSGRFARIVNFQEELGIKRRMFTCSGGDSQLGIGPKFHICHRSFYLDEKDYVKTILSQPDIENWDISHFRKGSIDLLRNWYIVNPEDEKEAIRFGYVMRNYHDFLRFQIAYIRAMMIELAQVGQAEKEFLENDDYLTLFALFVNSGLSCPMENLLNTGSLHLTPVSLLRMFGNGAFREIVREFNQREKEKKEQRLPNQAKEQTQISEKIQEVFVSRNSFGQKLPKIYFYNLNVGSGNEKTGSAFVSMLDEYKKEHSENLCVYKFQNPPCILVSDLVRFYPDVIVMNDYHSRLLEACYYYKQFKKNTKVILLNHCYDKLLNLPLKKESDSTVAINHAFQNEIDYIINLNYHPEQNPYPPFIQRKTLDMYTPRRDDEFYIKISFSDRKKDFLFVGNLLPHKLSREFVHKFSKTNMKMDLYGRMFDREDLKEYNELILKNENFNYLGYHPPEKMVDIYNRYRFYIVPHCGYEPLLGSLLEALKTGIIPLICETGSPDPRGNWLGWAEGLYFKHDTVDELLRRMKYIANKNRVDIVREYSKKSTLFTKEINERASYQKMKEKFLSLIFQ